MKTPEEIDWDEHLMNQEMDLRYYQNKIEEIQSQRNGIPKFRVGGEVRLGDAEMTIEEIIRAGDMRNTRRDGMFMYLIRGFDSSDGFFVCLASEEEIQPRRKKAKKSKVAACLMAPTRRDDDPDNTDSSALHDLSVSTELEEPTFFSSIGLRRQGIQSRSEE